MFHGIKRTFQVCINHGVKIFLCHLNHQIVPCDSRIVYQNINMSESRQHICDHLAACFIVRHTALHRHSFPSHGFNLRCNFLSLLFGTIIIYNYICTILRKRKSNLSADAAPCACH